MRVSKLFCLNGPAPPAMKLLSRFELSGDCSYGNQERRGAVERSRIRNFRCTTESQPASAIVGISSAWIKKIIRRIPGSTVTDLAGIIGKVAETRRRTRSIGRRVARGEGREGRNCVLIRNAAGLACTLIVAEKEQLVFDDGPAKGAPELLPARRRNEPTGTVFLELRKRVPCR